MIDEDVEGSIGRHSGSPKEFLLVDDNDAPTSYDWRRWAQKRREVRVQRGRRAQVEERPMVLRRYDKVVALTSRANTPLSALCPAYRSTRVHVVCRYLRRVLLLQPRPIDR